MKFLVVVDMQNDFIDGALGTKEAQAIVGNVAEKIKGFDGRIVFTKDTHYENYLDIEEGKNLPVPHCIKGTDGWQLNKSVQDAIDAKATDGNRAEVFLKPTFGSTEMGSWFTLMAGCMEIEEVVVVGLCTDICVISNALLIKAFLPNVKVSVDASCCAGVTPESHNNALAAMKMCQINVENWEV